MNPIDKPKENNNGLLLPLVTIYLSGEVLKGSKGIKTDPKLTHHVNHYTRNQTIELIRLTLRLSRMGLMHFLSRGFMYPLVGENACQIRALKLLTILERKDNNFSDKIQRMLRAIEIIETHLSRVLTTEEPKTTGAPLLHIQDLGNDPLLKEALKKEGLACSYLCDEQQFVAFSYLLTQTRDEQKPTETNECNLRKFTTPVIDDLVLRDITLQAKTALSRLSLEYLVKQVIKDDICSSKQETGLLKEMIKATERAGGNINASPCFFNLLAIMRRLMVDQTTVVVKMKPIDDLGQPCGPVQAVCLRGNKTHFVRLSASEMNDRAEHQAFVVEGVCRGKRGLAEDYMTQLLGNEDPLPTFPHSRLLHIVLANAAAHPQYAGDNKETPIGLFKKVGNGVSLQSILSEVAEKSHLNDLLVDAALKGMCNYTLGAAQQLCKGIDLRELALAYVRFTKMKAVAVQEGLCGENDSLFSIKHIYNLPLNKVIEHG